LFTTFLVAITAAAYRHEPSVNIRSEMYRLFIDTEAGLFDYLEDAQSGLKHLLDLRFQKHKGDE
jgi:hypothetical protein